MQPTLFQPARKPDFTLKNGREEVREVYVDKSRFGQLLVKVNDTNPQLLRSAHLPFIYCTPDITEESFSLSSAFCNSVGKLYASEDNFVLYGPFLGVIFFSINHGIRLQISATNTTPQMTQLDTGNIAVLNTETSTVTVHNIIGEQIHSFPVEPLAEQMKIFPLLEGNFMISGESTDIAIYGEDGERLTTIPNTLPASEFILCTYNNNPETSLLAYLKEAVEPHAGMTVYSLEIWDIQDPVNPQPTQTLPEILKLDQEYLAIHQATSRCHRALLRTLAQHGYQPKPLEIHAPQTELLI